MHRVRSPDWRKVSWHYKAIHALGTPWHNPLAYRANGLENIPREGGFLFAGNHTSWWDPILMAACVPRPVFFMAKKELIRGRVSRWFFEGGGCIPIDRNKSNPRALAKAADALRDGRIVGIFPEATRHVGQLGTPKPGVARLALETGVPVLPAAFLTDRFWGPGMKVPDFRQKAMVNVGKPMRLEGDAKNEEDVRRGVAEVMAAIGALLDDARAARDRGEKWVVPR